MPQYLTPVPYTFDILMSAEFRGRSFPCNPNSLIPYGPSYDNPEFQSCASTGASRTGVQGDDYLQSQFGFGAHNFGRNFGILIGFTLGFLLFNMWLVESLDWAQNGGALHEFASAKKKRRNMEKVDEESTEDFRVEEEASPQGEAPEKLHHSGATFSWCNLNYSVPHNHGEKQLLRNVSGFCEPGNLTALVGASGAGKSTRKLSHMNTIKQRN